MSGKNHFFNGRRKGPRVRSFKLRIRVAGCSMCGRKRVTVALRRGVSLCRPCSSYGWFHGWVK